MVVREILPPSQGKQDYLPDKESREDRIQDFSPFWLAGMLEAGGGMFFKTRWVGKGQRRHRVAIPVIQVSDTNLWGIEKLKEMLGGRTDPTNTKSKMWKIEWAPAVDLSQAIKPYAPSLQEKILAFWNWANADYPGEKLEIAKSMKSKRRKFPDSAVYAKLVKNPAFVAGVFDVRASISTLVRGNVFNLSIRIISQNKGLLDAIQSRYGFGSVYPIQLQGETREIKGRTFELKNSSWEYSIHDKDSEKLLASIERYVRLKR